MIDPGTGAQRMMGNNKHVNEEGLRQHLQYVKQDGLMIQKIQKR